MTKKERLQMLITGKTPKILEGFKAFDSGVAELKKNLEETIRVSTLDEVGSKLNALQKKVDFTAILSAVANLKQEITDSDAREKTQLETKLTSLKNELTNTDTSNANGIKELQGEIDGIQTQIAEILSRKPIEIPDFTPQIIKTENALRDLISTNQKQDKADDKKLQDQIDDIEEIIKKLRIELLTRIGERGGGNMNREELFNGVKRLVKYTDINWKAGTNVTFTIVNNETLKTTDVTVSATGGGGGTTRVIQSISASQNADSASGTDYVYLCSGTMTLTLPDPATNTNLYTVKNVGTGVITIDTLGGTALIDNNSSIQMATQFTSVDLISDTANWNIT